MVSFLSIHLIYNLENQIEEEDESDHENHFKNNYTLEQLLLIEQRVIDQIELIEQVQNLYTIIKDYEDEQI